MNINEIAKLFRALGVMPLLDQLKYLVKKKQLSKKNSLFKSKHPTVVLPPDYMVFESFGIDYEHYYDGGLATAKDIVNQFASFRSLDSSNLLDWGCGPARVVRHLPHLLKDKNCKVFGTDYNPASIEWCKKNISNVEFRLNQLGPPLAFDSSFFHFLYGISIFTHLSEEKHYEWMDELLRVCQPGALLLLTTHGDVFKKKMTKAENEQHDQGKLVIRANVKEGHRIYVAFQPKSFMLKLFEGKCEVLHHLVGGEENWGLAQDEWLVRKL